MNIIEWVVVEFFSQISNHSLTTKKLNQKRRVQRMKNFVVLVSGWKFMYLNKEDEEKVST
jgi:hypothetical protein